MSPGPAELLAVLAVVVLLLNTSRLAQLARRLRGPRPPGEGRPGSTPGP